MLLKPACRIDQWLCATRLVKSRSLAAQMVESGQVYVNDRLISKPAASLHIGDRVKLAERFFTVLILGDRRLSFPIARKMYVEKENDLL